jgi:hypothetical protein
MSDSPAAERRARATVRRFSSAAEADRDDSAYWKGIPAADRVLEVWRLSQEQWAIVAASPHEPGLSRSVASVRRRSGPRDLADVEGLE